MTPPDAQSAARLRFGPFEADIRTAEFFRNGRKLRLAGQSAQLLVILVQRAGHLVTREDLRIALWPEDTYVDFGHGLNNCISRIREALGDSVGAPRYIETLPKQGYRFICEIRQFAKILAVSKDAVPEPNAEPIPPAIVPASPPSVSPDQDSSRGRAFRGMWWTAISFAVATVAFLWLRSVTSRPTIDGVFQLTDDGNTKLTSALVSDGSRIYFNEMQSGSWIIAQVASAGGQTSRVASTIPVPVLAALSPDSANLLVRGGDVYCCFLELLPLPAGEARRFPDLAGQDGTFTPDGRIVLVHDSSLYLAGKDGSKPQMLHDFSNGISHPSVSPDATRIRLTVFRNFSAKSIWEVNSDGSGAHPLLQGWQNAVDACCGRWTSDGRYFVFQSRRQGHTDLWALPERTWGPGRFPSPRRLTNGPLSYELPFPSLDGKHIFAIGLKQRGELVRYDSKSQQFLPYLSGVSAIDATVSRDGKWVTYLSYPDHSLWCSHVDGSQRLQLTYPPTAVFYPVISPGGTKVAFESLDSNNSEGSYVLSLEGGIPRKIADNARLTTWSSDSNSVIVSVASEDGIESGHSGLLTVNLETGRIDTIPGLAIVGGAIWPAQDMIVARTDEGGIHRFLIFDFKTRKWSELFRGSFDHWMQSVDRKYIYYSTHDNDPKIFRFRFSDHKVELLASLKSFRPLVDEDRGSWVGVTPDGSVLLTRDIGTQEIYDLRVHWP